MRASSWDQELIKIASKQKKKASESEIHQLLIDFFKKNPNPQDTQIHDIADKIKIEPSKLETHIYMILSDFINKPEIFIVPMLKHGLDKDSDFDKDELTMGIEVEKEHNDNEEISKAIAKSHLSEIPDYYTRLKKMEEDAKAEKQGSIHTLREHLKLKNLRKKFKHHSDKECKEEKVAVAPEGWEGTVKKMKEHPEIDNPWALAHYMKNKGDEPHYTEKGTKKK